MIVGPGSGKTTVLIHRIKYLIEERDIPPEQILTITFSKKAATEMQDRFLNLCEDTYYPVTFGTFHSVFFQIIHRIYHYGTGDILTLRQKRDHMAHALKATGIVEKAETELIDSLLKSVAYYKNTNEKEHADPDTNLTDDQFFRIYRAYRDAQIAAHKIDFEDMLLIVRNLFAKHKDILGEYRDRYRYILIDEFQDINDIQYDIVRMLAAPLNNLFVVGDDDQSIYGFRGSRSELMLGFTDIYPDAVKIELSVNYRCAEDIIMAAAEVIGENKIRFDKKIRGLGLRKGEVSLMPFANREDEDERILNELKNKRGNTAIFLRTNREASRYAELIISAGFKCDMKEAVYNPYKSGAYKDIYHYLALAEHVARTVEGCVRPELKGRVRKVMLPAEHLFPVMNKPVRYINRKNILCDEVSIEGLMDLYCDRPYMAKVLGRFAGELESMCRMDMHSRINYIRKGMGYDDHIRDNVTAGKEEFDEYMETADWIQEKARAYRSVDELNRYAVEYEEMMAEDAGTDYEAADMSDDRVIHVMTYHASKGLEFDTVILPHLNEGSVPHKRSMGQEQTEEERRMFYVAMTRAKERLIMTYVSGDRDKKSLPSRFILPLLRRK